MIQINKKWVSTNLLFSYTFYMLFTLFCILHYPAALAIKYILNDYIFVMASASLIGNLWYFRFNIYSFCT